MTYTSYIGLVAVIIFVLFAAFGCSTKNNYYTITADNHATVTTTDGGAADQSRDVRTDAVNPKVDNTGDVGIPQGLL